MESTRVTQHFSHVEISRDSLADTGLGLVLKKKLVHQWSSREREVLCLLYKFFSNSITDLAPVFNRLFQDILKEEGFEEGLRSSTLSTQWHDMRVGSNGNNIWRRVHIDLNIREARDRYHAIKNKVEDTAYDLQVELRLRADEQRFPKSPSYQLGKRTLKTEQIRGVLGDVVSSNEESEEEDRSPRKIRHTRLAGDTPRTTFGKTTTPGIFVPTSAPAALGTSKPKPKFDWTASLETHRPQSLHSNRDITDKDYYLPNLVYRFSDSNSISSLNLSSEFRAGMFRDRTLPIPPPPLGKQLEAYALRHLTPEPKSTPFISVFGNVLQAFHRGLKSSADPLIAVIDLKRVQQSLGRRFPGQQVVYKVPLLCKQFDFRLRYFVTPSANLCQHLRVIPEIAIQAPASTSSMESWRRIALWLGST